MSHYDEETLALLALGESGASADDGAHLITCEQCRAEVDQLRAVVTAARGVTSADSPAAPSAAVWDRIAAEVRADAAESAVARVAEPGADLAVAPVASLDERRERRPRRIWSLTAAAAVGIILGAGATYALTRSAPALTPGGEGQVTVASLDPLDDPTAKGDAVLRVSSPTQRTVTVSVKGLPTKPGAFYEVWLMDPSNAHLVALGVLDPAGKGDFVVPAGLDLSRYSAVDVSLQPMNGSPLHSSNSAVRGIIKT